MAVILSIETSTSVCSAALHENGNLLLAKELHIPQSAASQLAIQIGELFTKSGISKQSVNAVAVSSGRDRTRACGSAWLLPKEYVMAWAFH
ncbi:MAG: hypothetical protein WDN75_00140 [Bacteroidota bacterium]